MKTCYDVSTCIASMGLLNMLVPCFDLLHVSKIMHVWREIYYCHFFIIAVGIAAYFIAKPTLITMQKKRIKISEAQVVDTLGIKQKGD